MKLVKWLVSRLCYLEHIHSFVELLQSLVYFLRAAASRCRAKKKVWIDELEKKAKDLDTTNKALQQEVLMLRSEVQQLKSILIAHKDCPLIVHQTVHSKSGEHTVMAPHTVSSAV